MITAQPKHRAPILLPSAASQAPPHVSQAPAIWTALPGEVIEGGEIVLLAIKPSAWRPIFDSAPWVAACVLVAAFMAWLGKPLPGLSVNATTQVILLIALTRVGVAVVRWVPTWHVLTNRRIIDIKGVRTARIASCPLIDIRSTDLQRPPIEKLMRLGTITFTTDHNSQTPHIWRSIDKPEEVHAKIRRAIQNAGHSRHGV